MATINRLKCLLGAPKFFNKSFIPLCYRNSHHYHCFSTSASSCLSSKANNENNINDNTKSISKISLSQPVPWIPSPEYATPTYHNDTKVTVLDNGLRVASQPRFGMFCTVGVLIDSGSRYETNHIGGTSHFLEKLGFSATRKFADRDAILKKLEQHGGICDCQGSRDTLIYAVSAAVEGLPEVTEVLAETVLKLQVSKDEVDYIKQVMEFELESLEMKPDPDPLLVELIHAAAYQHNTLGLPKICPAENLQSISRQAIISYLNQFHTPDRMVLAGVGVDHEELVELARKHFTTEPVWTDSASIKSSIIHRDLSPANYIGGSKEVIKDLSNVSLGPTPMPELAHFVIGLESCSHKHEDFVAVCVLNMLMGGGGSFSAGGPGKGMYTRLYLNVLNKHHWIHNAIAVNHSYNDSGLFYIHASAHPASLKELTHVILRELSDTQGEISPDELSRAKVQLQSMLLMNLEARPVVFEDVGRQVLASGKRMPPEYYCDLIDKVTEGDIKRVAKKMLSSTPSVAALGNLKELPKYEEIRNTLAANVGNSQRRFSLFRS